MYVTLFFTSTWLKFGSLYLIISIYNSYKQVRYNCLLLQGFVKYLAGNSTKLRYIWDFRVSNKRVLLYHLKIHDILFVIFLYRIAETLFLCFFLYLRQLAVNKKKCVWRTTYVIKIYAFIDIKLWLYKNPMFISTTRNWKTP